MGRLRQKQAAAVLAAGIIGVPTLIGAQQQNGISATLDVAETLRFSDNPDFIRNASSGLRSRTDLSFGLEARTSTQEFLLDINTGIDFALSGESDNGIEDPSLNLGYTRQNRDSLFETSLQYREFDVNENDIADLNDDELVIDGGTRADLTVSFGFEVGRTAPIGASLDVLRRDRTYSGTTDPTLVDETLEQVTGRVNFRINPQLTARVVGTYISDDEDGNGTDSTTRGYQLGATAVLNPVLTLDASIGYREVDITGGSADRTEDGATFDIALTRALQNGDLTISFGSTIGDTGRESTATVDRALTLPNGLLDASFGLVQTDEGDLDPLYGLNYQQNLPRGDFSVGLTQALSTDASGDESINSSLSMRYLQELTSLSSLETSLSVRDTNRSVGTGSDTTRFDLSFSYRHEVAQDWDLIGGYTYSRSSSNTSTDITSNTIFVGLEKSYNWRP